MTRILVIDDEAAVRTVMAEILESSGYEVEVAETAERGLELLDSCEPELVEIGRASCRERVFGYV